ncbi:MAG: metallophosphoesterase [Polyangiaceae bacterium]|nr:metallophosphoesterase [Polyangiaceae bacterium]
MVSLAAFMAAFSTANAAMADVDLLLVNDFYDKSGALVNGDPAYEVAEFIQQFRQSTPVTAVLATEVNNKTGSLTEYNSYINPVWSPFKSITRAVPGNHDWMTSGATGFKGYFGVSTTYTSFTTTVGSTTWKIIGIDSNLDKLSYRQQRIQTYFLNMELAHEAQPGEQCSIVYFHHPRWSSGQHGSNASVDGIWRTLANNNVELALSGHDHNYERFWPQDADGNRADYGVTQVVAGVGGAGFRNAGTPIANSSVLIDTDSNPVVQPGVLIIHLYDSWPGYLVMYQTASGALLDYWWGSCY